jgi:hypothetical protein
MAANAMGDDQPPQPLGAGVVSVVIAGAVAALNLTYLVLANTRELTNGMQRTFQILLFVGASSCVVGAILGLRGAMQPNRHTNVSILGLLLNCSIVIGFVVIHVLRLTGFH